VLAGFRHGWRLRQTGSRVLFITASARSLPSLTCGAALAVKPIGVWPAIIEAIAGPEPLKGTCEVKREREAHNPWRPVRSQRPPPSCTMCQPAEQGQLFVGEA